MRPVIAAVKGIPGRIPEVVMIGSLGPILKDALTTRAVSVRTPDVATTPTIANIVKTFSQTETFATRLKRCKVRI